MSADTILVDQVPGETRVAALAEGRLVDLAIARGDPRFAVGAIHLGRIAQVVEGFDGAFVDIGLEQAAFLRRSDALAPPRAGDTLPVQIVRAVAGEKGLGVSGRIRLAGWLLDWTPGRPGLRAGRGSGSAGGLALVPSEGAELRPAAGDVPAAALEAEAALLREAWDALATAAARAAAPMSLAPAPAPWLGLAAHHGATVRTIAFADRTALAEAQRFARDRAPALGDHLGVDPSGIRLFETHGVEEEIAAALRRRVPLRGGGALTIDEAEALTVVDVDAGTSRSGPRAINRAAIPAVAAALRLRSIGGQIIVDFVREGGAKARDEIVAALRTASADDPEPVEIAGWSRLGLLEMTRRRSRPSLASLLSDPPSERAPAAVARAYDALRAAAREAGAGVTGVMIEADEAIVAALEGPLAGDRRALSARHGITIETRADRAGEPLTFRLARIGG